jgi:hypothetical protein
MKEKTMKKCTLSDFVSSLKPWLSDDYIREAGLDDNGNFYLLFMDGVKNVYKIDDCTKDQLVDLLSDLKNKGIDVSMD